MRSLIDERAELQAALQEETRTVTVLRQRLGLAQKENEDLACSSVSVNTAFILFTLRYLFVFFMNLSFAENES